MLTAQKDQQGSQTIGSATDTMSVAGLSRMLDSVQGLQQRLGELSSEEIALAAEKTKTLVTRLSELQSNLQKLTEVQQSIIAAQSAAAQITWESEDFATLQFSEPTMNFQAIVRANNLIPFLRLPQTVPESYVRSAASVFSPADQEIAEDKDTSPYLLGASDSAANGVEEPISHTAAESTFPEVLSEQNAMAQALETPVYKEPQFPPRNAQTATPSSDPATAVEFPPHDLEETLQSIEPEQERIRGVTSLEVKELSEWGSAGDFSLPKSDADAQKQASDGAEFDHRLLDDLIKNYGEFVISPNLPAAPKSDPDKEEEPTKRKETIGVQSAPAASPKESSSVARKDGELDQKLKKLIKDYGEYDIYSHRNPISLKTGIIAAVLLLAVILSGVYFFSGIKQTSVPGTSSSSAAAPIESSNRESVEPREIGSTTNK